MVPGAVAVVLAEADDGTPSADGRLVSGAGSQILAVVTADAFGEASRALTGGPKFPRTFTVRAIVEGREAWSTTNAVQLVTGTQ